MDGGRIILTPKETAFVDEYIRSGDASLAAHVSGVRYERSPTDMRPPNLIAAELLEMQHIKQAVEGRVSAGGGVRLTKDALVADAYEIKEKALSQERFSEAINALKLVGDFEGMRNMKVEVTHKKEISMLTEEELLRIISGDGKYIDVTPVSAS